MNAADALVGLRLPLQALKAKISLATQALVALACLEAGHEKIRSYRSIRGELAMLFSETKTIMDKQVFIRSVFISKVFCMFQSFLLLVVEKV